MSDCPAPLPGPGSCARAISCHAVLWSAVVISARSTTPTLKHQWLSRRHDALPVASV
jgi:hypothetical protein